MISTGAWVEQIIGLVSLVRPNLDSETRDWQRQSLDIFRTFYFDRIKFDYNDKEKRGFLFEYLVLSDPRYPQRSEVERQVGWFLHGALQYDLFGMSNRWLNYPDDIAVEIRDEVAFVVGLVEIKLDLTHERVKPQLEAHQINLKKLEALVNLFLAKGDLLPVSVEHDLVWPDSVKLLAVPDDYDRVVFKPAGSNYVEIEDWQVISALFSRREVRVIADFLWHLDR